MAAALGVLSCRTEAQVDCRKLHAVDRQFVPGGQIEADQFIGGISRQISFCAFDKLPFQDCGGIDVAGRGKSVDGTLQSGIRTQLFAR